MVKSNKDDCAAFVEQIALYLCVLENCVGSNDDDLTYIFRE